MIDLAHLVGWTALFFLGVAGLRRLVRGSSPDGSDTGVLELGAACAGAAVLLYAAATRDALIAVLALVWVAVGLHASLRQPRRSLTLDEHGRSRKQGVVQRPVLRVVTGGRATTARRVVAKVTDNPAETRRH